MQRYIRISLTRGERECQPAGDGKPCSRQDTISRPGVKLVYNCILDDRGDLKGCPVAKGCLRRGITSNDAQEHGAKGKIITVLDLQDHSITTTRGNVRIRVRNGYLTREPRNIYWN